MLQRESACADDARLLARDRLHDREVLGREWRTAGVNDFADAGDELLSVITIDPPMVMTEGLMIPTHVVSTSPMSRPAWGS
ncbi:hypothetical protein [Microbacterium aurantiacum]|uniref:hypothetical protein n=1 Tax=Microbacterium aurantiacum TaxID=162393 RepID=UPI0012E15006|nr:hypothetical protein [Microbacterium chocolatum]